MDSMKITARIKRYTAIVAKILLKPFLSKKLTRGFRKYARIIDMIMVKKVSATSVYLLKTSVTK